jgi:hypothetical protein
MTSRALRNSNPLNLRPSGDNWKGLRTEQTDPGFLQFISPFYGLRAGAMNLLTYAREHNRRTVTDIIGHWAPPGDNNPTSIYIDTVCKGLGVGSRDALDLETPDNLRRLMELMIQVEAGEQPFTKAEFDTAIAAAYNSHRSRPVAPGAGSAPTPQPTPQPTPRPVPQPSPAPAPPVTPKTPSRPRDEIVPPSSDKPPLVDQPSPAPTRKVVAGGLAGALAFVLVTCWNRWFPDSPIPAEYATAIAGAAVYAATLVTQYFVRNRATDIPPAPAATSPRIEP